MNDDDAPAQQLEMLKAEHRRLDSEISALEATGDSDQLEIARLKKRKLNVESLKSTCLNSSPIQKPREDRDLVEYVEDVS